MLGGKDAVEPRVLYPISFEQLSETTFVEQYRFQKNDIEMLLNQFELPINIKLDNGYKIDS